METTIDNKTAPFQEYPSIDLFAKKNIRKLPKELQDEKWVALEKVCEKYDFNLIRRYMEPTSLSYATVLLS